jgi:hypothetical protein
MFLIPTGQCKLRIHGPGMGIAATRSRGKHLGKNVLGVLSRGGTEERLFSFYGTGASSRICLAEPGSSPI